jgi:hypothetical protein
VSEILRLWSVTEILDMTIPKRFLIGWAARVTAEAAVRQRAAWLAMAEQDEQGAINYLKEARWRTVGRAADRGNALHAHAKAYALGIEPPAPPEGAEAHIAQFVRFLNDWQPEYLAAEQPVYNATHKYAGTLDAIMKLDGLRVLGDYKTTDKGVEDDGARPPYDEVGLQLCAYRRAEVLGLAPSQQLQDQKKRRYYNWDTGTPSVAMEPVDGAVCLVVSPSDYALHPIRTDEKVWQTFLHCVELARWDLEVARTVVGAPMPPPARPTGEAAVLAEAEELLAEGVLVEPTFEQFMDETRAEGLAGDGQAKA